MLASLYPFAHRVYPAAANIWLPLLITGVVLLTLVAFAWASVRSMHREVRREPFVQLPKAA